MNIYEMLANRQLPALQPRQAMVSILQEMEYGFVPDTTYEIEVSEPEILETRYCARTVTYSRVMMTVRSAFGSHSFPIQRMLHTDGKKRPVIPITLNILYL